MYDKLYRYCFMKIHDPQTAEDITQDTFMRYFSTADRAPIKNPNAYLYTIARNLCIDYYRTKPFEPIEEADTVSSDDWEQSDLHIALEQAMDKLPEIEQEILFLRYTNDVSVSEIAESLGLSRFAVHRKEKHALKILRERLDVNDFL